MNEMVPVQDGAPVRRSVTIDMATRYGMDPVAFERTVRSVCMPVKHGDPEPTREEFAAFLLVAREYKLNPITREIYAMKRKGGGLIPVVSVDGWVRLINEHPAFDGVDFDAEHDGDRLVSMTCKIYRKDRSHPTVVTEYLTECIRDTEPWKMKHRMLRHKSIIQCGRYAMGFAGIYDPDEAERFAAEPANGNGQRRVAPSASAPMIEHRPEPSQQQITEVPAPATKPEQPAPQATEKPAERRRAPSASQQQAKEKTPAAPPAGPCARFVAVLKDCRDNDDINEAWVRVIEPVQDQLDPDEREDLERAIRLRLAEIDGDEGASP